ncbi:MAG: hypothetical protein KHZ72_01445 [Lachnospiraceae bacterium]|nr:hypothetical protein [Lachnospiraceae bacterium]
MVSREKIHKLLDLVLDIRDLGESVGDFPYVAIDFSNYGFPIYFRGSKGGFHDDYDYSDPIRNDRGADCAIEFAEDLFKIAKEKVGDAHGRA